VAVELEITMGEVVVVEEDEELTTKQNTGMGQIEKDCMNTATMKLSDR